MVVIGVLFVIALVLALWLIGSALVVGFAGALFFDQPWRYSSMPKGM